MVAKPRGVVLLSGGLDSATTLAIALDAGYDVYAITFWYGQRHSVEIESAKRVAERNRVHKHLITEIDLRGFGGSALTDEIAIPKDRSHEEMSSGIPVTYVPGRNTIFLSFAMAYAEIAGAFDVFAGMNALDNAGYPDCRPEYLAAFESMANLATRSAVEVKRRFRIHTPLIAMSKAEIVAKGMSLGVDFSLTSSCYDPSLVGDACGRCDACILRMDGFRQNGTVDPIKYSVTERLPS